jgi:hypothetical protein
MKRSISLGAAVATAGTLVLVGVTGAAFADETEVGSGEVDVSVDIAELTAPGQLAMTVGGASTTLTENGSTDLVRQFTGTLPTVTITDTRTAEEIPEGVAWYVLGSSTGFIGNDGQPEIGAGNLGWAPHLIDGGDSGLVAEGDQVDTVMDEGPDAVGLIDQELFAIAADSATVAPEGQWAATADLFLRTPATVEPGSYSALVTLSLFE